MNVSTAQPRYLGLIPFLVLTLAAGTMAGIATARDVAGWYATLAKPSFNPPNWIFAPVWTTLYILMAIAAWRVWRVAGLRSRAMLLFALQLALNVAWSFVFFTAHRPAAALAEVVVLLAVIVITAAVFRRYDRLAGLLFVPYAAWVGFATLLNAEIVRLN